MTTGGEIYLAIILVTFLTYIGTLFWAMTISSGSPDPDSSAEGRPTER